jgi:hypothetical protein
MILESLGYYVPSLLEQRLFASGINEAPRSNPRPFSKLATLRINGNGHHNNAVSRQQLAFPKHAGVQLTCYQAAHIDGSDTGLGDYLPRVLPELKNVTVLKDEDILLGYAHTSGQSGMQAQMAVFPVDRNEVLGLNQAEQEL